MISHDPENSTRHHRGPLVAPQGPAAAVAGAGRRRRDRGVVAVAALERFGRLG